MRRYFATIVLLALAVALVATPHLGSAQSANPWPTFHGNSQRTGYLQVNGPTGSTLINRWDIPSTRPIQSSVAVDAGGNAYVGDNAGNVYSFVYARLYTNQPRWTFTTGGAVRSSPTLSPDGKTLYVGSEDTNVYAIDTATGHQVWKTAVAGPVDGSPAISNDGSTIYVTTTTGTVYGIGASDGKIAWHLSVNSGVAGSPALSPDGTIVYVATTSTNQLISVPSNGQIPTGTSLTSGYLDAPAGAGPAVDSSGNVYVVTKLGSLFSFAQGSASARWTFTAPSHLAADTTPAITPSGDVIFGDEDGKIYGIKTADGTQAWSPISTGGQVEGSPTAAANSLAYIGSTDNNLYAINYSNGSVAWTRSIGGETVAAPAIGPGGTMWIGTNGGQLFLFGPISSPPPPGTAPPVTPGTPGVLPTVPPVGTPGTSLLSATMKSQVKAGAKQTIHITTGPRTVVRIRIDYPNGDHQSHRLTTKANGKGTYTYTQGASKIFHNRRYATVIFRIGTGATQVVVTKQYKILPGKLDVSAEPRTAGVGQFVDIWVHTSKRTQVSVTLLSPNHHFAKLGRSTGPNGWAHFHYKVAKSLRKGKNTKVKVQASTVNRRPNYTTSTTFTIP